MSGVWAGIGLLSWGVAWWLWPEGIVRRMPSVILLLLAQAAFVWGIILATGRLSGRRWLILGVVLNAAAILVAVQRGAPILDAQSWHAGLVVLILALVLCASFAFEHIGDLARTARQLRDAQRRLVLDRDVSDRPRRVFDALAAVRHDWNLWGDVPRLARLSFFGDPTSAPERVVVWGVLEHGPMELETAESDGRRLLSQLGRKVNRALHDVGYPTSVDVGVAAAADVDAAGGEGEYFGADGRRQAAQEPARPG
ncbi:MAG TPA: hypothetical protein VFO55_11775 [Gemmatimonadaceae bacterium]|nr:hypothetical protein [Gemmatimonadaceae bacterium]